MDVSLTIRESKTVKNNKKTTTNSSDEDGTFARKAPAVAVEMGPAFDPPAGHHDGHFRGAQQHLELVCGSFIFHLFFARQLNGR